MDISEIDALLQDNAIFETEKELKNEIEFDNFAILQKHSVSKAQMTRITNNENLKQLISTLPEENEVYHIISSEDFDLFTFIPVFLDIIGVAEECFVTTWGISNPNVNELCELYDIGKIKRLWMLTGEFFKTRYPDIYANLALKIEERKQEYRVCRNHTKIIMLKGHNAHIVIESSANLTSNPRLEQTCVFNDRHLYQFHKTWMLEIFKRRVKNG